MDEREGDRLPVRVCCVWVVRSVPVRGEPKRTEAKSNFVKHAIVNVKERDKPVDVYLPNER